MINLKKKNLSYIKYSTKNLIIKIKLMDTNDLSAIILPYHYYFIKNIIITEFGTY